MWLGGESVCLTFGPRDLLSMVKFYDETLFRLDETPDKSLISVKEKNNDTVPSSLGLGNGRISFPSPGWLQRKKHQNQNINKGYD